MSTVGTLALCLFLLSLRGQMTTAGQAPDLKTNQGVKITFQGYVRDLAYLVKFEGALKPINDSAGMCPRGGSPLVIVTEEAMILHAYFRCNSRRFPTGQINAVSGNCC